MIDVHLTREQRRGLEILREIFFLRRKFDVHCSDWHTFYCIMNKIYRNDEQSESSMFKIYPTCFTLFSMMSRHSSISDSVMVRGGANRMMLP